MSERPADHLAWMREQLARHTFWDWQLTLHAGNQPDGPAILVARYTAPDSRHPGQNIRLSARRPIGPIPASHDPQASFTAALETALRDVWAHEFAEGFRYDGHLVSDPHVDPTRWHCLCGGVGPQRTSKAWTCPGCGRSQP